VTALIPIDQARAAPTHVVAGISPLGLSGIVRTHPAREVAVVFAEVSERLAARLAEAPGDYAALVGLGELWLRVGRAGDAKVLLERAAFQPPPSWGAHQYLNLLLRRAETLAAREFKRGSGSGLPGGELLLRFGRRVVDACRGSLRGNA